MAHSFDRIFTLTRMAQSRSLDIQLQIGARGGYVEAVRQSLRPTDHNVEFLDFVSEEGLEQRLTQVDIHLVTLKDDWTGVVVPSKFFAAIAAGKPVIFSGSRDSAVAKMIENLQLGWVLDNEAAIAKTLTSLEELSRNPQKLLYLQRHCWEIYQKHFSKATMLRKWKAEFSRLVPVSKSPALSPTETAQTFRRGA